MQFILNNNDVHTLPIMTVTLEQVQKQIAELQKIVESLKEPRMEVSRHFTGEYLKPYRGKQYRRMESEGIPIWEYFWEEKRNWVLLERQEIEELEDIYIKDCILENN